MVKDRLMALIEFQLTNFRYELLEDASFMSFYEFVLVKKLLAKFLLKNFEKTSNSVKILIKFSIFTAIAFRSVDRKVN